MADQPSNGTNGVVKQVTGLTRDIATSLPAPFLALCLCNVGFLLGVLWFLNRQNEARLETYGPILTECVRMMHAR